MFSNVLIAVVIALAAGTTSASARGDPGFPDVDRGVASAAGIADEESIAAPALSHQPPTLDAAQRDQSPARSPVGSAARGRVSIECQRVRSRHDHAAARGAAPAWITPCSQSHPRRDDLSSAKPGRLPLHDHRGFHKQQ